LDLKTISDLKAQSKTGATGFGALSEKELSVLENGAASLQTARDEKTFLRELKAVYEVLDKVKNFKPATTAAPGTFDAAAYLKKVRGEK
jgi:hypothetical protein